MLLYVYVYSCAIYSLGDLIMSDVHTISSLFNTLSLNIFPFTHVSVFFCICYLVSVGPQRGARPVSAPVFSQAALAEAGIPMALLDQPQTSTPIKSSRQEERKLEVTVEAVEPSKIEDVAEDKVFNFSLITVLHVCIVISI